MGELRASGASNPNESCAPCRIHFVIQEATSLLQEQTTNREKEKKNAYFHRPQRTTSPSSQGRGASTTIFPQSCDPCQNVVPRCCHPRTLHDRAEDGEEGVTAWRRRRRWWSRRENSSFDVLFFTLQCNQLQFW